MKNDQKPVATAADAPDGCAGTHQDLIVRWLLPGYAHGNPRFWGHAPAIGEEQVGITEYRLYQPTTGV